MRDAVIVGSGPNGLAAAIVLSQAGEKVLVLEQAAIAGGGARSAELTLPGCIHDVCSAVHPLAANSPLFRRLALDRHGLTWVHPPIALAHPFDDGTAAALHPDIKLTSQTLAPDAQAYRETADWLCQMWPSIEHDVLGPFSLPRHPFRMARFGLAAIQPAARFARGHFRGMRARALFAGLAGHSGLPLDSLVTSGIALVLAVQAHLVGWPIPEGGAQSISQALLSCLSSLGGELQTSFHVKRLEDLPASRVVLFDLTPRQVLDIAGQRLPRWYRRQLEGYRYGTGVFKYDAVTEGPIPFLAEECRKAGTVHLGGTLEEIAEAEQAVSRGRHPRRPFVILSQPSVFDPKRAPNGLNIVWSYCHVPLGSQQDLTAAIENQIERFAPGFRRLIVARHSMSSRDLERYNPNYVGGSINGGVQDWRQLYTRPAFRLSPYSIPVRGFYLCSSSTPPGGGVHGMCGYHAAHRAIKYLSR